MKTVIPEGSKTRRAISLLTLLLCTAILLAAPGHAQPLAADVGTRPWLTEAKAIQIAKDFCRKIGQPVTVAGQATFPDLADYDAVESWSPIWRVYYSQQAEVHVVDRTGAITHYSNIAYFRLPNSYTTPRQSLPQADALRIARATLDATGQREELGNQTAELRNSTIPPSYQGNEWFVSWDRMSHGVPYLNEGPGITMNAQTGEIEVIIVSHPSLPVAGTEAEGALTRAAAGAGVTPAQAVGVGAAYLSALDLGGRVPPGTILRDSTPLLRLVRPKDGWSHFQDAPGQARSARPAWLVRIMYPRGGQEVWVDAETGEALGGDIFVGGDGGVAQTAPPPPPDLAQMIGTVRAACVLRRAAATKNGWKAAVSLAPGGKGLDKDQAPALAALRAATDFRTDAPAGDAPQQVVLVGADNAVATYSYYPDTGLLGRDKDWAVVPSAFRVWAQTQTAAAPAPPKK